MLDSTASRTALRFAPRQGSSCAAPRWHPHVDRRLCAFALTGPLNKSRTQKAQRQDALTWHVEKLPRTTHFTLLSSELRYFSP